MVERSKITRRSEAQTPTKAFGSATCSMISDPTTTSNFSPPSISDSVNEHKVSYSGKEKEGKEVKKGERSPAGTAL